MNRFPLSPVIVFLLCVLSTAYSVESGSRVFRVFTVVGKAADLWYDQGVGEEAVNLDIYGRPSPEYTLPLTQELTLFRKVIDPGDPNKTIRENVITVPVPTEVRRILLALLPVGDGNYHAKLLQDDFISGEAEGIRLINLASLPVAFRVNESQRIIDPGETVTMEAPDRAALVQQAVQRSDSWIPVMNIEKRFVPGCRYTYIVFNYIEDPDSFNSSVPPPVLLRTFVERVPPANLIE